jgi:Cu(I)/Ag(I) efflux system membrane protein CusA/SilA
MDGAPSSIVSSSSGGMGGMGAGGGGGMGGGDSGAAKAAPPRQMGIEPSAAFVPLGQLARIEPVMGPPMIKSELGSLNGWVYVDISSDDIGGYVNAAKAKVAQEIKLPPGYYMKWTGQYELLERVRDRMAWILPLTLAIVFVILYLNFRGVAQSLIVMTSVRRLPSGWA